MIKLHKVTYGKIKFKNKKAELTSYDMDKVMSPYDGVVVKTVNKDCNDGYLLIQHNINDLNYYSQFCGVRKPIINLGDNVRGGTTLGFFENDPIIYSILSSELQYINPEEFLSGVLFKNNKNVEKSKDPLKKTEKKTKKPQEHNKYEINALSPITIPIEFVTDKISKGVGMVGKELKKMGKGMFQFKDKVKGERLKKKKEEEENQSLSEEIVRIKKLLK